MMKKEVIVMNDSEKAFAKWWAAYLPDDSVKSSTDIHRAAWDAATERAARIAKDGYTECGGGISCTCLSCIAAAVCEEIAARIRGGTP